MTAYWKHNNMQEDDRNKYEDGEDGEDVLLWG